MKQPFNIIDTENGKVLIREAGPIDTVPFCDLRQEALRNNPTAFGSSYEFRENCSLEWATRTLQFNPRESCYFVVDSGSELLGMAGIRRNPGQKTRHSAFIYGVYIRQDWRKMGIVDGLFEVCFEWAKKNQLQIIKLAVVTSNLSAFNVYQRLGFKVYGTEPKANLYKGNYYDEFLMFKELY